MKPKFDIITSDPIHPWVKGAATLYTQEYFELCKARLNEGGLITQWVPLAEGLRAGDAEVAETERAVGHRVRTFEAFVAELVAEWRQ